MDTSRAKILVVEDDANLSRATALRLKAAGFEAIVARDAYQAVKYARQEKPALVILDVRMPAGDGLHVHEHLNQFSDFMTPIIYLTGHASNADEAKARELGALAYLRKPVDFDELIAKIRAQLGIEVSPGQES
ncbi:MAG: response regulator transcription factor [Phycisphaerae bacterium]|jgi:two-component system response regulator GlrR